MIKRSIFIVFYLILFGLIILPKPVLADPADVTYLDLIMAPATQTQTALSGVVHFPWNEALYLIKDQAKDATPSSELFVSYKSTPFAYIKKHLFLTNNDIDCPLKVTGMPDVTSDELMFGEGIQINIQFTCPDKPGRLVLKDDFFVTDFPLQTNIVNVFEDNSKTKLIQGGLLTGKIPEMLLGNTNNQTPPQSPTMNPLFNNTFIQKLAANLGNTPLALTLFIVFILGFLHTLEAGHSKTILTSLLLNKKVNFRQAIGYSAVFTVTHIADILLLGLILLAANAFVDVFSELPYLQVFSLYSLFFIAWYLLLKNTVIFFKYLLKLDGEHFDHEHELPQKDDFLHQLLLGVVAGIAPCLFGWSIFMVILSTRKVWYVFPVIGAFGLGIFAALLVFALIMTRITKKVIGSHSLLAEISPIISALILLFYSLIQIL